MILLTITLLIVALLIIMICNVILISTSKRTNESLVNFYNWYVVNPSNQEGQITIDDNPALIIPAGTQTTLFVASRVSTTSSTIEVMQLRAKNGDIQLSNGPATELAQIQFLVIPPEFVISWNYHKKGDTFEFLGDPAFTPYQPPTCVYQVSREQKTIINSIGDEKHYCGAITIYDGNKYNKYKIVMEKQSNYSRKDWRKKLDPEWATIYPPPYVAGTNYTPNGINWDFKNQSGSLTHHYIEKKQSQAINMETGVSTDIETVLLVLGGIGTAGLLKLSYDIYKAIPKIAPISELELVENAQQAVELGV